MNDLDDRYKFRAWDKKTKSMCDVWDIGWKAWDFSSGYAPVNYVNVNSLETDGTKERSDFEVILMQWTGLKDKNGKEIYEGDVVIILDEPHVVEFRAGCFLVNGLWGDWIGEVESREMEVTGNIYENPELLQAK